MPNFRHGLDAEATSTRLAVFETEPLKSVRRSCTRWMRKNYMPIFHYFADVLKHEPLFSDNESDSESDGNNSDEGGKFYDFDRKEHFHCHTLTRYLNLIFHKKCSRGKFRG